MNLFRVVLLGSVLSGCTLFESKRDGMVDSGSGSNAGPVGRTFNVQRSVSSQDPCASFGEETLAHGITIQSTSTVFVDGIMATNVSVRPVPAQEGADTPNVQFSIRENWNSDEGPAMPQIDYTLFTSEQFFTGHALASFIFESPISGTQSCSYGFTVF